MGKKGSWISAIKRAFSPHSKEKLSNQQESERKSGKEKKKKGFGREKSFLPIFREPSSIEKILGEAERDHNLVFRPPTPERSNPYSASPPPPIRPASPRVASPRPTSPRVSSPRPASPRPPSPRAEPPRLDSPRALTPKPRDRSKPSSASTNAPPPPLLPASTRAPPRVASPRTVTLKPPSPKPTSPRVASQQQAATPKPPSPREETPPRPPSPRAEPPRPPSPRAEPPRLDAPRPTRPKPPSPRTVQLREIVNRPEPTLFVQHASATKIQAAFRGHTGRRSFRALKGLVRLQGVVRGHSVKRQTINAMKYMQQLVRVQSQIQARRIRMLEHRAQVEKDEAKWSAPEGGNGNWDDSVLTKEERDARSQRKIDAFTKRERSMAYAYSRKLWKNNPKSAQDILRTSGGLPLWWNWMDRQLPLASPGPSYSQPLRDYRQTPTRLSPSPLSQSSYLHRFNNFDASTPRSARSTLLTPSRPMRTGTSRYSGGRLRGQDSPFNDVDSLTSCPPFPSYMAPTASAKAKVRPTSNPKERLMSSPANSEKRRMSFPMTQQGVDMFRWNTGSLLINKGSGSPGGVVIEKHKTLRSVGNMSMDSTASGKRAFNRFV